MSHLIGKGRYGRETYPTPSQSSGGIATVSPSIALMASFVGGESSTTDQVNYDDVVPLDVSPFSAATGTHLYVAGFIGVADTGGLVDLYDYTDARSLLADPIEMTNSSPAVVYSAALVHPMVSGHHIALRAKAVGDSPNTHIQSAYVL